MHRCHPARTPSWPAPRLLTVEMGEEPEQQAQSEAEENAGDDGKVERSVFAAIDDVAGQAADAEGQAAAEVQEGADDGEQAAEKEQGAAEFAERLHKNHSSRREK